MNFLKRILGLGPSTIDLEPRPLEPIPPKPPALPEIDLPHSKYFPMDVVGESNYQKALEFICGQRTEKGENRIVEARLVLDDANQYDNNAVRVEVVGMLIGHLARADALKYRAWLAANGHGEVKGKCQAKIKGGWQRGRDDIGHYGVYLSVNLPK